MAHPTATVLDSLYSQRYTDLQRRIVHYLLAQPRKDLPALAQALQVPAPVVREQLDRLAEDSIIQRHQPGNRPRPTYSVVQPVSMAESALATAS